MMVDNSHFLQSGFISLTAAPCQKTMKLYGSLVRRSYFPHLYLFILIVPLKYFISGVRLPAPAYLGLLV